MNAEWYSCDVSDDGKLLASITTFYPLTRIAIWNRVSGKLLFTKSYPCDGNEPSPLKPNCCRAIGDRGFCFSFGAQLYVYALDSQKIQIVSTKNESEKYTGITLLGVQLHEEVVKATWALTPIDSESIREIEFKLD